MTMTFDRSAIRGGTVYTQTARFDTGRAMTEDELRRAAPSVFAVDKHDSRSDRFKPIPTYDIVKALAKEGFHVVGAKQSHARTEDKRDYTKHLLRLRRLDDAKKYSVGDTVMEMLLKNANDGTSAYDLMAGLFRICCLNSLVAQTDTIDTVKVRHSGDVQTKVIEGTWRVVGEAERVLAAPQDWAQIKLSRDERMLLAETAHVMRFGEVDEEDGQTLAQQAITPVKLLAPRRQDDTAHDLWTTFNVIQENVIKGGLTGRATNEETQRTRRVTTRPVKGIDQDVKLNKALWVLTERMAQLKGMAAA